MCDPISARPILDRKLMMMVSVMSLRCLIEESRGVTAIEYGLIAALIAVAAVVVMGTVGTNLSSTFNTIAGNL
jgi:pilus assembly protein Flp/PilA